MMKLGDKIVNVRYVLWVEIIKTKRRCKGRIFHRYTTIETAEYQVVIKLVDGTTGDFYFDTFKEAKKFRNKVINKMLRYKPPNIEIQDEIEV